MNNEIKGTLDGKYCDCCGRRCPLENPGCGIGMEEAQRVLSGGEAPTPETARAYREMRRNKRKQERDEADGRGHEGRRGHGSEGHGHGHEGDYERGHRHGHRRGGRVQEERAERHGRRHGRAMDVPLTEDERLSRVLHHCARMLVHRERHQGGQAGMLAVLASHGEMTQARLADKLDVRSASASELLSKMEEEGLVKREPDAEDGRANKVELTDAGAQAAEQVMAERRERDAHLFEALDADEKEQLTALLDKLARSWHRGR